MATLDDIVAATKILAEDSETLMSGSGSKLEEERVKDIDGKKNDNGDDGSSATGVVRERFPETETVAESTFDRGSGLDNDLGGREEDKAVVENMSSVSNGGVSVEGIGGELVDDRGSLDGVAGSDGKVRDGHDSRANLQGVASDYMQLDGADRIDSVGVDEGGSGEKHVQKLEDHEHEFRVGDFVWGKIRSHPWWPGQVYDLKDASDFAVKHSQEGRLLVAFFGDGSCSWCLPSQLIPFVENFVEMSRDSSSKSFLNAIDRAINEVGRVMELNMTCNCIPEHKKGALARPMVENAGVRAGVFMPQVDVHRLSIPVYEPSEVRAKLVQFAKFDSVGSALELAILRSWVSAFYRFKGGHELPSYHEAVHIEGMEDKNQTVSATENDFSVPIEVPILGPRDDDFSSPTVSTTGKSQASSGDKTYHRRKQKSIAELMETSNRKETDLGKSSPIRKRKRSDNEETEGGGIGGAPSTEKRGRKRKVVVVNEESSGGRGEDAESEGPVANKAMEVDVAAAVNTSSDAKEEVERISSPRERKKSKYLSPPYTNLTSRIGNSSFKMSEIESDKKGGMVERETRASGEPIAPPSNPESFNLHDGQEERLDTSVSVDSQTAEKEQRLSFPASDVDVPVYDVFAKIQLAAIDPLYLSREGSLDMVCAFFSALRSSTYLHGSNYKTYCRSIKGKKRKSGPSQLGTLKQGKKKSQDESTPEALEIGGRKDKFKSKKVAEISGSGGSARKVHGKASPCLILTFSPGFPLPSKENIISLFGKFGTLNEKKTTVATDSHLAKIVFMKDSDAESALKASVSQSPFGLNVTYKLQNSSTASKARGSRSKVSSPVLKQDADIPEGSGPSDDLVSDVKAVKKKLEIMTAILENYHSEFTVEDKSSLKDDLKGLMEKVENVSEKVEIVSEKVRVMAESSKSL